MHCFLLKIFIFVLSGESFAFFLNFVSFWIGSYLASARELLVQHHGNKETLVEKEPFFYEDLSSDINKALKKKEPVPSDLMHQVEASMKENGLKIEPSFQTMKTKKNQDT